MKNEVNKMAVVRIPDDLLELIDKEAIRRSAEDKILYKRSDVIRWMIEKELGHLKNPKGAKGKKNREIQLPLTLPHEDQI